MSDRDHLERRLRTVERTLTGEDHDLEAVRDRGELLGRVETLEERLDDARARIDDLEAANQALRGYVGNVRSVNEDVEQRAEAALAAVDRLEDRLADRDQFGSTDARVPARSDPEQSEPIDRPMRTTDPGPPASDPSRTKARSPTDRLDRNRGESTGENGGAEADGVLDRLRARL